MSDQKLLKRTIFRGGTTKQEIERILAHIEGSRLKSLRDRSLVLLLFDGVRRVEIERLRLENCDLAAGILRSSFKGLDHEIHISKAVVTQLLQYVEARGNPSSGPLLLSCSRAIAVKCAVTGEGIRRVLDWLRLKAGIDHKVLPSSLRKTRITEMLRIGARLEEVLEYSRNRQTESLGWHDDRSFNLGWSDGGCPV